MIGVLKGTKSGAGVTQYLPSCPDKMMEQLALLTGELPAFGVDWFKAKTANLTSGVEKAWILAIVCISYLYDSYSRLARECLHVKYFFVHAIFHCNFE